MTRKFVFGVAVVALAVLVMAPSASASCIPNKNVQNFGGANTGYWTVGTPGVLTGTSWQVGGPGNWSHTGGTVNCDTTPWLYFTGNNIYINLQLGACGAGCPTGGSTFAVSVQNQTAAGTDTLTVSATENTLSPVFYDLGQTLPTHTLLPIPRPRVTASARVPGGLNLTFGLDATTASAFGPGVSSSLTGFRILGKQGPADPGRDASAYNVTVANVPSPGGAAAATATIPFTCSGTDDLWLVTQLVYEGGAVLSPGVSAATRARCNPALADPNPKYKIVAPKKGMGTGSVKQ